MTTTVEERIETALFKAVAALELSGDPPLAWPNVDFPGAGEDKPGTYVEVLHLPNRVDRLMVKGAAPHLRQGILQLIVVTPLNGGPAAATALAGSIAAQFPADTAFFEEGTKVRVQAAPDIGGGRQTDDQVSWSARVSIRYECFE